MSVRVFISYSRRDGEWATSLARVLGERKVLVWIDESAIPASVPWQEEIRHAVRGAAVIVAVDTPAFRASASCRAEIELAMAASKTVAVLDVTSLNPTEGANRVVEALQGLEVEDLVASDLLARASRWSAGGRPRHGLADGKSLRAYRRVLSAGIRADLESMRFLRASTRRRRRRIAVVAAATALVVFTMLLPRFLETGGEQLVAEFAAKEARLQKFEVAYDTTRFDPANGLPQVIDLIEDDVRKDLDETSYVETNLMARVLDLRFPRVRAKPTTDLPPRSQRESMSPDHRLSARIGSDGRTVEVVEEDGGLLLRVRRPNRVVAVAWDPRGANIAVADTAGVGVHDAVTGNRWSELLLSAGVRRLGYSGQGEIVAEMGDGMYRVWLSRTGSLLSTDASQWFMDAATASDGRIGLVTRGGDLIELDPSGAEVIATTSLGDVTGLSIAPSADAWHVGIQLPRGDGAIVSLPLDAGAIVRTPSPDCLPRDVAWTARHELAIACGTEKYATMGTDRKVHTHDSQAVGVEAVSPFGDEIVIAGGPSELFLLREQAAVAEPLRFGVEGCWGGARVVATAPTSRRVFVGGVGLDSGCLQRLTLTESAVVTDRLPFEDRGNETRAMVVSPDEQLVAYGTSTGLVQILSVGSLNPLQISQVSGQEIRGLAFNQDGSALIVATRHGEILRLPVVAGQSTRERMAQIRSVTGALPAD